MSEAAQLIRAEKEHRARRRQALANLLGAMLETAPGVFTRTGAIRRVLRLFLGSDAPRRLGFLQAMLTLGHPETRSPGHRGEGHRGFMGLRLRKGLTDPNSRLYRRVLLIVGGRWEAVLESEGMSEDTTEAAFRKAQALFGPSSENDASPSEGRTPVVQKATTVAERYHDTLRAYFWAHKWAGNHLERRIMELHALEGCSVREVVKEMGGVLQKSQVQAIIAKHRLAAGWQY